MDRYIDLFSGIGGFRVALDKAGMKCVFSSDIDRHARAVYEKNFGEAPAGDIMRIRARDIPRHDVLCAGFPCQPFSISGKYRAFGDERGALFFEIVRIAKHHKPRVLLLENVKNILTIGGGDVMRAICQSLDDIGYRVRHYMLNASDYGMPQRRERVYFVALRKDCPLDYGEAQANRRHKYLKDIMLPAGKTSDMAVTREVFFNNAAKGAAPAPKPIRIGYLNKGGQGERIYSVNGHAITLSANGGGVGARTGLYYCDGIVRRLHIDEAKRAMGFSARHAVSAGTQGYKQLGNAVIPAMIKKVYHSIQT